MHPLASFQSHYGAIATQSAATKSLPCKSCFQSHYGAIATGILRQIRPSGFALSIPLWCDCNLRAFSSPWQSPKLLSIPLWCDCNVYLYIMYPTGSSFLSIPLWCDCNLKSSHPTAPCTALSIPLWCDCNWLRASLLKQWASLSIPLWCDCNLGVVERGGLVDDFFQSHYGAIATVSTCRCHDPERCFQSHYGAIATNKSLAVMDVTGNFQSHYGAIATRTSCLAPCLVMPLSIPLWCDCNMALDELTKPTR